MDNMSRFQFRVPLKCKKCGLISWKKCNLNEVKIDLHFACNCLSGGSEMRYLEELPPQQCLGITDDQSQELWERDIVLFTPLGHMAVFAEPFTGLIKWDNENARWLHTFLSGRPDKCLLDQFTRKHWKITKLGNEITNPDLIEQLSVCQDDPDDEEDNDAQGA